MTDRDLTLSFVTLLAFLIGLAVIVVLEPSEHRCRRMGGVVEHPSGGADWRCTMPGGAP